MPMKWTPTNVQMLFWLAWGNCRYEAKDIVDAWPSVPGEEAPTKIAVQHKIGDIRKGVRDYGVASFFGNGASIPSKARRSLNGPGQPRTQLTRADDSQHASTDTANGLQHSAEHGATVVKEELSNTTIKPENLNETVTAATEAAQHPSTPPKTPGRGRSSAAIKSNTRKRRRSDASDFASMTTEGTPSEISITAPDFEMKLRPDHRNINLHESDGEIFDDDSDGSDSAWVPGFEDGIGRRKRVRRH